MWIAQGQLALQNPTAIDLPHQASEAIVTNEPTAVAYRVELRRGQSYRVLLDPSADRRLNIFVDLFRISPGERPQRIAGTGPPARYFAFEPRETETFVLRLQSELLADGRLRVSHTRHPALLFPVAGGGRDDIHSFYGAARNGGRREHQGIDIFARRGTAVLAAADGWISSTTPNRLGGNVVWIWDPGRRHTLYYAHLDRHVVSAGQRVSRGDVVGFVGNTGNARSGAPHLHFGIYRPGRGAIDPLHYVAEPP
jgi:murein DD-endopeptidase MepM/ murein hydrolase activator NlpD